MRILSLLLLLAILAWAGWPYLTLYQLDRALMENDQTTLASIIDIEALRAAERERIRELAQPVTQGDNAFAHLLQQGVQAVGEQLVESSLTIDSVRDRLRREPGTASDAYPSILRHTSFAFFESPSLFLVRVGELGQQPVHLRLRYEQGTWRMVGLYD